MTDFYLGLFSSFWLVLLFEPLIINFIYLSNIDLFFDLFITKKNKDRLNNYFNKIERK